MDTIACSLEQRVVDLETRLAELGLSLQVAESVANRRLTTIEATQRELSEGQRLVLEAGHKLIERCGE